MSIPFADNFLAGSLLSLLLPVGLLIAVVLWYLVVMRRVPGDTAESSAALPPPEVVAAAGPEVREVTPTDPPAGQG
jgi:hypothetical protein